MHRPVNKFKPLSYTRAREILLSALRTVGYDESLYGLHSLRSGGVSAAVKIMFQIDFFELTVDGPPIGQKMAIFKMNCTINF